MSTKIMEDLLSYRTSIIQKATKIVPDLVDGIKAEKFWHGLEKLEKRELDYLYALIQRKEIEILQEEINKISV